MRTRCPGEGKAAGTSARGCDLQHCTPLSYQCSEAASFVISFCGIENRASRHHRCVAGRDYKFLQRPSFSSFPLYARSKAVRRRHETVSFGLKP